MYESTSEEFRDEDKIFARKVFVTRKTWSLDEVLKLAGLPEQVTVTYTDDERSHTIHKSEIDITHTVVKDENGVEMHKVQRPRQVLRTEFYEEYEPIIRSEPVSGQPSDTPQSDAEIKA